MADCKNIFSKQLEDSNLPKDEKTKGGFTQKVIDELNGRANKYIDDGDSRSSAYSKAQADIMEQKEKEFELMSSRKTSTILAMQDKFPMVDKAYKEKGLKGAKRAFVRMIDASIRGEKGEARSLTAMINKEQDANLGFLRSIFENYEKESGTSWQKIGDADLANAILYHRQQIFAREGRPIDGEMAGKPSDKHIAKLGQQVVEDQRLAMLDQTRHGNPRDELSNFIHGNKHDRKIIMRGGRPRYLEKLAKDPTSSVKGLSNAGTKWFYSKQGKELTQKILDYSSGKNEDWEKYVGEKDIGSKRTARAFATWFADQTHYADFDLTLEDIPTYKANGELNDEFVKEYYKMFRNLSSNEVLDSGNADIKAFGASPYKRRQIHFDGAKKTAEYTKQWGGVSTGEALVQDSVRRGHQLGMLKWGGGNIHTGFNNLLQEFGKKYKDTKTSSMLNGIRNRFNLATGNIPQDESVFNTISQGLMTIQNFAKLGLVTPSSLPDSATLTTALMSHGVRNPFDLMRNHIMGSVSSYMPFRVDNEYSLFFDLLGVGANFMQAEMAISARAGEMSSLSGKFKQVNNRFFQINLLHHHDSQVRRQGVAMVMRQHGMFASSDFNGLAKTSAGKALQRELGRSDIGSKEWNFYRQFVSKDSQGRSFLNFGKFNTGNLDKLGKELSVYDSSLKTHAQKYYALAELYDKYTGMLDEFTRQAIVTPTAGTRYYLHGGWLGNKANLGSPLSTLFSLLTQYKNFPMQLSRVTISGATHNMMRGDYAPMLNYVASSMMYNYLAWGSKSMLMLKSWPSFEQMKDNKQRYQSFLEHVFAPTTGILDMLLGNEISQGNQVMGSLMGPTGMLMQTLVSNMSKALHGDTNLDNLQNEMVQLLSDVSPTTTPILGAFMKAMLDNMKTEASKRMSIKYMHDEGQTSLIEGNR